MQKVAIDSIVIDDRIMVRDLDQKIAVDYANKMKDGVVFPPVVLFEIEGKLHLSSGRHRLEAHKLNGSLDIDSIIKEGSLDDAYLFALQDNAPHGHRLSKSDVKEAIKRIEAHPVWSGWTNTTKAKIVGVTAMTVGRIKRELEEQMGKSDTVKKYVDKKGVERKVDTAKLATKKAQEPEPEEAIGELTDVIDRLEEENKKLKDAVALGQFDATEIEKIDIEDTLAQLREENRVLQIENEALKKSRDQYQKENAELIRTVKSLQNKMKKAA